LPVEKIHGKVVRVKVALDHLVLSFIKNQQGKVIHERQKVENWLDDAGLFHQIYQQVCAIFTPPKSRAEKIKVQAAEVKKRKPFKTIFTKDVRLIRSAWQLHLPITDYKTKHDCAWTEAAFEIIKSLPNHPLYPDWHSQEEKRWLENLKMAGMTVLTEGWLETRRWERTANGKLKRIFSKVEGINSGIRMQDHILEQYRLDQVKRDSELTRLETIEEVILKIEYLLSNWSLVGRVSKNQIQRDLAWTVLQLDKCRNEFKVSAREKLEDTIDLKDSLNRLNPAAMSARTVSALNQLTKRFNELEIIMPIPELFQFQGLFILNLKSEIKNH